jgi:hypothetical protein
MKFNVCVENLRLDQLGQASPSSEEGDRPYVE